MKPRLFAAEIARRSYLARRCVASMRLRLFAAEICSRLRYVNPRGLASMRPRLFAAEIAAPAVSGRPAVLR